MEQNSSDEQNLLKVIAEPRPGLKLTAELELSTPDGPARDMVATVTAELAEWSLHQAGSLFDAVVELAQAGHFEDADILRATTERLICQAARQSEAGSVAAAVVVSELHEATVAGDIEQIGELLREGADVNVIDGNGLSPLHVAVATGGVPAIDFLLANGADPANSGPDNPSPLHFAAGAGWDQIIEAFITHKVDVNLRMSDGSTPLHHAARFGRFATAKFLVANGADVNATTVDGLTAVAVAERHGHNEIADMLRRYGGAA